MHLSWLSIVLPIESLGYSSLNISNGRNFRLRIHFSFVGLVWIHPSMLALLDKCQIPMTWRRISKYSGSDIDAHIFVFLSLEGLMQGRQLSLRRSVVQRREQSPLYIIRMVNQAKIHACFIQVHLLSGEALQQSETHLMPSIEVS